MAAGWYPDLDAALALADEAEKKKLPRAAAAMRKLVDEVKAYRNAKDSPKEAQPAPTTTREPSAPEVDA